jgi:hypothetical protein
VEGPTPAPSQPGSTEASVVGLSSDATAIVLIVLIAAAVISLAMILWYNRDALRQYYRAALTLGGAGIITAPEVIAGGGPGSNLEATTTTTPLTISGPASGVLGVPTEYKATVAATWTVAPEGAGAINPTQGETVQFTAAQPGVVTIKATKDSATATIQVAVLEPSKVVKLPFVGRGYGTIAIGVVAIFVVFGLGITGRLGPEALATFFGGLLGVGAARAVTNGKGGPGGGAED